MQHFYNSLTLSHPVAHPLVRLMQLDPTRLARLAAQLVWNEWN